jgi:hypothetical protein
LALFTFLGAAPARAQFLPPAPPLLAPPPPPTPASNQQVQQLEQAERQDSGRRLQFVWLNPEAGFEWAKLTALSNSKLLDDRIAADATGLVVGGGAGVRLLYLTFGARFRYGLLSNFDLWTLGAEAALRIPYGKLEPYAFVGAGYAHAGSFKADKDLEALAKRREDLSMSGVGAQLGGGVLGGCPCLSPSVVPWALRDVGQWRRGLFRGWLGHRGECRRVRSFGFTLLKARE